jgi:hypothetical protein
VTELSMYVGDDLVVPTLVFLGEPARRFFVFHETSSFV